MKEQIKRVIDKLEVFMPTVDDALALPRASAMFVHAVVRSVKAKQAVEIGTSYGYSGLWIASALSDVSGRLVTIDKEPYKSDHARKNFADAGLISCITLKTGVALEVLADIPGPVDFVLNDADKENCAEYVELLAGKISPGGVILTDNTVSHAEQLGRFVEWVRGRDDFFSAHVPVGSGMEMTVRLP